MRECILLLPLLAVGFFCAAAPPVTADFSDAGFHLPPGNGRYLTSSVTFSNHDDRATALRLEWRLGEALRIFRQVSLAPGETRTVVSRFPGPHRLMGKVSRLTVTSGVETLFQEQLRNRDDDYILPDFLIRPGIRRELFRQNSGHGIAELTMFSNDYRSYIGFEAVALTSAEYQELAPAERKALDHYVQVGGTLVLVDSSPELPDPGIRAVPKLFGQVIFCRPQLADGALTPSGVATVLMRPMPNLSPVHEKNIFTQFSLLMGSLLLFGPGCYWYLRRKKRLMHMYWVFPAGMMLFCAGMIAYAGFSEGLKLRIRHHSVIMVDETDGSAAVIGWNGYYSSLIPAGALRFSEDAAVNPIGTDRYDLELDGDQRFLPGVIRARTPLTVLFRRVAPAPGKLRLAAGNQMLHVTNDYPVGLTQLRVFDRRRNILYGTDRNIPPGGSELLTKMELPVTKITPDSPHWAALCDSGECDNLPAGDVVYRAGLDRLLLFESGKSGGEADTEGVIWLLGRSAGIESPAKVEDGLR